MSIPKADHEQVVASLTPLETDMTVQEFLESDLEGYEYVKGELIPMPPTSGEHGDIRMSLVLFLGPYVHENQLGRVYALGHRFSDWRPSLNAGYRLCFSSTTP